MIQASALENVVVGKALIIPSIPLRLGGFYIWGCLEIPYVIGVYAKRPLALITNGLESVIFLN